MRQNPTAWNSRHWRLGLGVGWRLLVGISEGSVVIGSCQGLMWSRFVKGDRVDVPIMSCSTLVCEMTTPSLHSQIYRNARGFAASIECDC